MKKEEFIDKMRQELSTNVRHSKTSVEKIAASFGIYDKTMVKELTELSIVLEARKLAHIPNSSIYERYLSIVDLYNKQVTLSHRTSQSMLLQQYSTPAPIGYIAGVFCGMDKYSPNPAIYFEPSAGNGLLTIASYPKNFIVNEIDETRNDNLKWQNYYAVKRQDATKPFSDYERIFKGVVTNPPFGKIDNIEIDGFDFSVLDHVMCIRALETMKTTGRAALIIGGHTTWDERGRIQAGKNRNFFAYLHKYYKVVDTINIDGHKLYSRQGTAFNVRLILIDGRKIYPDGFPPLKNESDVTVFTFQELYNRVIQFVDGTAGTYKNNFNADMKNELEIEAEALALELELMSVDKKLLPKKEKPQSIKDKVLKDKEQLKEMKTPSELRTWAISNGMDNRVAFPKFKIALQEIGIDYNNLRNEKKQECAEMLNNQVTHEVTLYSDAKASNDKFGITDEDGNVLWYGKFFDNDTDYNGEQSSGELAAAKKAVWLATKIKEAAGLSAMRLILMVDAQWLTYQDKFKQKGSILTYMANKNNIDLIVQWIPSKDNPADKWTISSGFKKWSDNNLKDLPKKLDEPERIIQTPNNAMNDDIRAESKDGISGIGEPMEMMTEGERLIAKKKALAKTKEYKLGIIKFPDNMPDRLIKIIKQWVIISKSPYSDSFYNTPAKSWDFTPEKSYRVANHWNFYSSGAIHCKTDKNLDNHKGWALAQYIDGIYKVLELFEYDIKKAKYHSGIYDKEQAMRRNKMLSEMNFDFSKQTIPNLYETQKMYYAWISLQEWKLLGFEKSPKPKVAKAYILRYKPKIKLIKGIYSGTGRYKRRTGDKIYIGRLVDFVRKDVAIVKTKSGETESSKDFDFLTGFIKNGNNEFNKWRKIYSAM